MFLQLLKLQAKLQGVCLQHIEGLELVCSSIPDHQRIEDNKKLVELEVSHLLLRSLHLKLHLFLFLF